MNYKIQTLLIALTCAVALTSAVKADTIVQEISYLSSYAKPDFINSYQQESFPLFERFDLTQEEHELNDAWLGMFVKSNNGDVVGSVAYAFLDADGNISELLVELSASQLQYAVFVDGNNAQLNELDVTLNLIVSQIANLERENSNQFARN